MTKENLIKMGVSEEIAEKINTEYEKELSRFKAESEKNAAELDGLRNQLEGANEKIKEFEDLDVESIRKKVGEWEEKYKTETEALKKQLSDKDYEYAVKDFLSGQKFSSELAKSAVFTQMKEKAFKLEDGKLIGADEFMKDIIEKNPNAFQSSEPIPRIVTSSGGLGGDTAGINAARAVMGLPVRE